MIKQSSIDKVRDIADLTEVMNLYTTVKNKTACCPFHSEKTASLSIKQNEFYKCFGCGKSGDVISLVEEMQKLSFSESIEWLANKYHIELEYDENEKESQDTKDLRTGMLSCITYAAKKYQEILQQLPADASALLYLQERGYDKARANAWQMGFAPDAWKTITSTLINNGQFSAAETVGLSAQKDGSTYDCYRNRIIIPIHNHNGQLVGIAGRLLPKADGTKADGPKYINPCESIVYSKKKVWYGLFQARAAIKELGFAYVVEGYMDVQAMYDEGIENVIAACGTEVDALQLRFLKKFTEHLVLAFDGDKAGTDKMHKLINECLKQDFKTQVLDLPEGQDPDEFIKQSKH